MVQELKECGHKCNVKDEKADYFSAVFFTFAKKIDKPEEQFKSFVLALLGDLDYEKIVEAVNKIDKNFSQDAFAAHVSLLARPSSDMFYNMPSPSIMAIFLPILLTLIGLAGDFRVPGFGVAGPFSVIIVDNSIITLKIVF